MHLLKETLQKVSILYLKLKLILNLELITNRHQNYYIINLEHKKKMQDQIRRNSIKVQKNWHLFTE